MYGTSAAVPAEIVEELVRVYVDSCYVAYKGAAEERESGEDEAGPE